MRPIVLLDRDGTINEERHYLSSPDQVALLPGAAEGIGRLRGLGLPVAVITNQSGIARGYLDLAMLDQIHRRLQELLSEHGTGLDRVYVCPHGPDDGCGCRKPGPELAHRAAADFQADLGGSFVIGDKASDVELGRAVGATSILVRTGYGARLADDGAAGADHCVADLAEAATLIEALLATGRRPRGLAHANEQARRA